MKVLQVDLCPSAKRNEDGAQLSPAFCKLKGIVSLGCLRVDTLYQLQAHEQIKSGSKDVRRYVFR